MRTRRLRQRKSKSRNCLRYHNTTLSPFHTEACTGKSFSNKEKKFSRNQDGRWYFANSKKKKKRRERERNKRTKQFVKKKKKKRKRGPHQNINYLHHEFTVLSHMSSDQRIFTQLLFQRRPRFCTKNSNLHLIFHRFCTEFLQEMYSFYTRYLQQQPLPYLQIVQQHQLMYITHAYVTDKSQTDQFHDLDLARGHKVWKNKIVDHTITSVTRTDELSVAARDAQGNR